MYSQSLQHQLVHAHIQDLHRLRQPRSTEPITTVGRTATRRRRRLQLAAYLARASERFVGHAPPQAYAF
jgi:hypothetical protein